MKIKNTITGLMCLFSMQVQAQIVTTAKPPVNWQLQDLETDGTFGISMEKAYAMLMKGKKGSTVIVAVIDGGVDVQHEDLKGLIWTNNKEKPLNHKDDDKNGYVDDVHGWNFFSTMKKGDEEFELKELSLRAGKDPSLNTELEARMLPHRKDLETVQADQLALEQMLKKLHKPNPGITDFKNFIPGNDGELKMQKDMVYGLKAYPEWLEYRKLDLARSAAHYLMELSYYEKQDYDLITGGPSTYHGTHVAGIIAANRTNSIGIKGVADHVQIMVIRTIPGIDPIRTANKERIVSRMDPGESMDLSAIAASIRYAVDNGAKIINMSFGAPWTFSSKVLDEAVNYAGAKDVLIVHAAGNDGANLEQREVYPNRKTAEGKAAASHWIEVGASAWKNDGQLAGEFSNYGSTSVDVYAPGVDITSTTPRSGYLQDTGTSMAAPVVAGLAAVIREYYPALSAAQVKEIMMKSVVKADVLKDKCISGGVVNAYQALKLAATY